MRPGRRPLPRWRCCTCSVSTVAPATTTCWRSRWTRKTCCWPMTVRRRRGWGWPCCGRCWPSAAPAVRSGWLRCCSGPCERLERLSDGRRRSPIRRRSWSCCSPSGRCCPPTTRPGSGVLTLVRALGAALGGGLPGRLLVPPPVAEHAHLVAVLRMLPGAGIGRTGTGRRDPLLGRVAEPAGPPTDPGAAGSADGSGGGRPTVGRGSGRSRRCGRRLARPGAASWLSACRRSTTSGWATGRST